MNRYLVTIEAWPHSTGQGRDVDQKAAGERSKDYVVRAMDFADAFRMAEAIAMGVRANPMVWRAPIKAIKADLHGEDGREIDPCLIRRWAVISLKDNGGGERQGYAYLYPTRPKDVTAVGGIGKTVTACIEIAFAEGQGLDAALVSEGSHRD